MDFLSPCEYCDFFLVNFQTFQVHYLEEINLHWRHWQVWQMNVAPKTFGPVRYYTRITNPPHTHHLPTTQLILTPSQRRRRQMIKVTLTSDRVSHNIRISFKDPTPFIDLTVKRGYRVRSLFYVLWPQKLKDYPCLDPFGSLVK